MSQTKDITTIKEKLSKEAYTIYNEYTGRKANDFSIDPLVELLVGACASEFKDVYKEISASRLRMLAYFSKLLLPESFNGPIPAHGVLHATPDSEGIFTSPREDLVTCQFKDKEIGFSPVGEIELVRGDVKWIAIGNQISFIEDYRTKQPLAQASSDSLSNFEVWLGIEWLDLPKTINQLTFFLNWNSEKLLKNSESILTNSTWSHKGKTLALKMGIDKLNSNSKEFALGDNHQVRKIEKETLSFYKNQFVTIDGSFSVEEDYPERLIKTFGQEKLNALIKNQLTWIKIEFAPVFFEELENNILDLINIQINCFPVLNRRLLRPNRHLNADFNLFPLEAKGGGAFFQIEEVLNSGNRKHIYKEKPLSQLVNDNLVGEVQEHRTYALRYDGVSRFDKRNATEVINDLIYILREETFVFRALGKDVMSKNLEIIRKIWKDMAEKLKKVKAIQDQENHVIPFIVFPPSNREYVIINYWTTHGELGNNIPPQIMMKVSGKSSFEVSSLKMMERTQGGRDSLEKNERLQALKSMIITKDRIVTIEDIENYCKKILSGFIKNIDITQKYTISTEVNKSFIRILKVSIQLVEKKESNFYAFMEKKLTTELNAKSSILIPIKVAIS